MGEGCDKPESFLTQESGRLIGKMLDIGKYLRDLWYRW